METKVRAKRGRPRHKATKNKLRAELERLISVHVQAQRDEETAGQYPPAEAEVLRLEAQLADVRLAAFLDELFEKVI